MKKEQGILIASTVGLLAAFGVFALRKFLSNKNYHAYYADYHRHFVNKHDNDDYHGIEYLALR
ncbi:hypothetical protein [uncultured Chryseobacterium sp.]|uniref:hypothetical protein n=1 Tax=uncultured Chryseobacterium sp. TaxID=259322 RepID=UPI002610FD18|nr:hypothetical protein [uncultured Chryseobacterium sp.]